MVSSAGNDMSLVNTCSDSKTLFIVHQVSNDDFVNSLGFLQVAFRTKHGKYMKAEAGENAKQILTQGDEIGDWMKFWIIPH